MRYAIAAAVALIVGIVLGGIFPRAEVRELRSEIAELEGRECRTPVGQELATLLTRPPVPQPEPAPEAPEAWEETERVEVPPPEETDVPEVPEPDLTPEEGIEVMKEALELRRVQARAALLEDADPDDAQLEAFDAAVAEMNAALREIAEDAVARVLEEGEPTRHEMMIFAADTLDVLIGAEDQMVAALDDEQLEQVDDASVDPFSYIDPSLLDLFAELDRCPCSPARGTPCWWPASRWYGRCAPGGRWRWRSSTSWPPPEAPTCSSSSSTPWSRPWPSSWGCR